MIKTATINLKGDGSNEAITYLKGFIRNYKLDVICLQELGENLQNLKLKNYNTIINKTNNKTGIGIIYNKELNINNTKTSINNRIIKIELNKISIICVYGYPKNSTYTSKTRRELFIKQLPKYMGKTQKQTIILGDFNAVGNKGEGGSYIKEIRIWEEAYKLKDMAVEYNRKDITFITKNGKSRIDRIYYNNVRPINFQTKEYWYSDHKAVLGDFKVERSEEKQKTKSPYWKMNISVLKEDNYNIILN